MFSFKANSKPLRKLYLISRINYIFSGRERIGGDHLQVKGSKVITRSSSLLGRSLRISTVNVEVDKVWDVNVNSVGLSAVSSPAHCTTPCSLF